MSEAKQGNPDVSAIVPLKRKRGRPRKYPRLDPDHQGSARAPRGQNLNHGEISHLPPGFSGINGSQPCHVDQVNHANDRMIGQTVYGVIEAAFDAGYLLSVRVGNSETALRGVVFKPGHYVPVNADIDVAPGVQMIRRTEISLPRENYAQVRSNSSWSRERNGAVHAARAAYQVADKGKQVTESSGSLRGNVVPVVLQPVKLSNGGADGTSSTATHPAHAVASKEKEVLDAGHPSKGSTTANQVQAVEKQLPHFQSQNNHQIMPSTLQHEAGLNQNSAETLQEAEASSMRLPDMPFGKLLTEVTKKIEIPSQSPDANASLAGKLSAEESSRGSEDDVDDDQALSVEPLRAVQPHLHNQPAVMSRPLENYRTGKMTELLQENMIKNLPAQEQDSTEDRRPN